MSILSSTATDQRARIQALQGVKFVKSADAEPLGSIRGTDYARIGGDEYVLDRLTDHPSDYASQPGAVFVEVPQMMVDPGTGREHQMSRPTVGPSRSRRASMRPSAPGPTDLVGTGTHSVPSMP